MIKDTDEQPDKEVRRARSERISSAGASAPVELECVTYQVHHEFTDLEAL